MAQSESLTDSCFSTTTGESSAWVANWFSFWLFVLIQVKTFFLHSSAMSLMSNADISSGHKPVHLYQVTIVKLLMFGGDFIWLVLLGPYKMPSENIPFSANLNSS